MKFVFAGTPVFAGQVLADLADLGRVPSLVISQPDRPKGRGRHFSPPPVVAVGERLGVPVIQVESINDPALLATMRSAGATTLVVAAFGQILRAGLLQAFDCLNVHASLLPRHRGAAPIARAIAAGDALTGVSVMRMAEGLDEGPWAAQTTLSIGLRDDAGSVGRALALLGAIALDRVMTGLDEGTVSWVEQEGSGTYARKITASECLLRAVPSAIQVHNKVRSVSPDLGVRTASAGVRFKIWRTWPYGEDGLREAPAVATRALGTPGALVKDRARLFVGCDTGVLELLEVQPAGKARMTAAEFMRGYGSRLGEALDLDITSEEG